MKPLIKNKKYLPIIYQNLEERPTGTSGKTATIKVKSINATLKTGQFHRPISKIISFNE